MQQIACTRALKIAVLDTFCVQLILQSSKFFRLPTHLLIYHIDTFSLKLIIHRF